MTASAHSPNDSPNQRTALVVGSTGIVGGNLARRLAAQNWRVYGLARHPQSQEGIQPLAADLLSEASVAEALDGIPFTDVFIAAWLRQPTESENVRVNGGMVEHLFQALRHTKTLRHATLVTGTKHYLGPFESYGQTKAETPFREDQPRLPGENFYYTQEDVLFRAADQLGFAWNVHRPHSIIGFALGNAMNMGVTLATYATICRETGAPFVFPGSAFQWNSLTDLTDARLLAEHLEWSALTPAAHNQAFNTVNGDIFRWRWMWPQLAAYFGIEAAPLPDQTSPLETRMQDAAPLWERIASKHALVEPNIHKLASWWHTDADLGRQVECVNDVTKSRNLGFLTYQESRRSFFHLFDRLKQSRIIPSY